MKFIHTSDWHLGKTLEGNSRLEEQEMFLNDFVDIVEQNDIDMVIIAGDIYDTSNPPAAAEKLFYKTICKLADDGNRCVVIISGNHDNPERLSAITPLAEEMGILVFGYPLSKTTEAKYKGFEITQALEGCTKLNINGEKVTLITLPYPSEKRLNEVIKGDTEREQQISYSKKVGDLFRKLEENFEVVADVGSGTEGISVAIHESPDLIILDLNMKGLSGLDTLKGLRAEGVDARILILTVSDAKNDIFTLIDAGADGYLLKDTEPDVLLEQIKRIAQGEVILSDSIKNLLLERKHTVDPIDSLTDREMDVLRLIATGLSNKQIAGQLFISEETVKVHIRNLLRKLNVHSRVAATVLFFERNGR